MSKVWGSGRNMTRFFNMRKWRLLHRLTFILIIIIIDGYHPVDITQLDCWSSWNCRQFAIHAKSVRFNDFWFTIKFFLTRYKLLFSPDDIVDILFREMKKLLARIINHFCKTPTSTCSSYREKCSYSHQLCRIIIKFHWINVINLRG